MMLPQNAKIVQAFLPAHGAALTGDWVSVKNYHKAMLIVTVATGASDVATVIAVDKATSVAAANESTGITLNNFWTIESISATAPASDLMTKGTAAAYISIGATQQSLGHMAVADIDCGELPDSSYEYDCLQANISSSNAAHFIGAVWVLYEPRYAQSPPPTAITD